jgi:uncharacterized protein (TIGR03437 family)
MTRNKKLLIAKCGVLLSVPILLWAHASGPDAHKTGVPGTNEPTCNMTQCHVGTPLNGGGGKLEISASGGTSYTPGQKQTLSIKITDSAARVYGFQSSARLASDRSQQAGTFSTGASQQVLCASTNINDFGSARPSGGCPSSKPLEFIEHSQPFQTNTISFDWTPPANASGDIEIYVSANAANGNGNETGDHIYNTFITLSPASSGGSKPAISQGGVINAAQFGAQAGVTPGTWIEIYGSNLSSSSREWTGGDFNGTTAPTSLDGVSVTVAGKPAFIRFISAGQVNAQVPDGIGTGPVPIVVTSGGVSSDALNVTATAALPGLLAPFNSGGKNYAAAFQGSTVVGSPGSAAVKPGDVITLYGIGFGTVNPAIAAGKITDQQNGVVAPLRILIGGSEATASYKGLGPNFVGLYQFNVTVPDVADGDQPVSVDLGGSGTGQTIFLTVKR